MSDRLQWDDEGDSLDEIVLSGVTFHMERMSHHNWWIGVSDAKGRMLAVNFRAMGEPLVEWQTDPMPHENVVRGALLYECPHRWESRDVQHRCEVKHGLGPTLIHRCECDARQTTTTPLPPAAREGES